MKKVISLFLVVIAFSSCTQEVTFNNPSVQGTKDNYFWRAKSSTATINPVDGTLSVIALSQFETLTLSIPTPTTVVTQANPITYLLGTDEVSEATFSYDVNGQNLFYATGAFAQDGQIILTEYDTVNKTVSGTYRFNAYNTTNNPLGNELVNFKQGVFYKVPLLN